MEDEFSKAISGMVSDTPTPVFLIVLFLFLGFVSLVMLIDSLFNKRNPKPYKIITGIFECILGFPVLGGALVVSALWTPLIVMLMLHIATYCASSKANTKTHGSIVGLVTSCLGWIPILGMIMHVVSGILILTSIKQNQVNVITANQQQ